MIIFDIQIKTLYQTIISVVNVRYQLKFQSRTILNGPIIEFELEVTQTYSIFICESMHIPSSIKNMKGCANKIMYVSLII